MLSVEACETEGADAAAVELAKAVMPPDDQVVALADSFKILSEPTRLRLVLALIGRELCVCDLGEVVGASQSAVSHQLRVLRNHRLVKHRREGKKAFYSLDDAHIEKLIAQADEHIAE